jgi:O-acetyl-ADP-ribose deacetylase
MERTINGTKLTLIVGDITLESTDAIVNAANSGLMGGGGVDGAIHRAGGPAILAETWEIVSRHGRLPTGQAVITTGGNLKARHVIHTVGPVWHGGHHGEPDLLASAYKSSLELAAENGLASIAFPSISTGAYGYPVAEAARVAVKAITGFLRDHATSLREVRIVLYSQPALEAYEQAMGEIELEPGPTK